MQQGRFLCFDCEGPITLNDNAFEFCKYLMPEGDKFFVKISKFDDYLAEIKKKPGYKAGDTLKLILPFLKAFGATNEKLKRFSKETLLFLPDAHRLLEKVKNLPFFIISTSYRPYLEALSEKTSFPMEKIFCTELDFDSVSFSSEERKKIYAYYEEILQMPEFDVPDEKTAQRLEEIFFEEIPKLECGIFLKKVNPVGGKEKARACEEVSKKLGIPLQNALYCGDSITDVDAFSLLNKHQGISLAFNGNKFALSYAKFYLISETGKILESLVFSFLQEGKSFYEKEDFKKALIKTNSTFGELNLSQREFDKVLELSLNIRKKIRGKVIGELG